MTDTVLCLGSNVGDRLAHIVAMESALAELLDGPLVRSRIMETEPVDVDETQTWYYNRLIRGYSRDTAENLLAASLAIETRLGRRRPAKNAPRTADIDILLFGNRIARTKGLTIPHPAILRRRFCLEGLREIAGEWVIPGGSLTFCDLAAAMPAEVRRQTIRFPESDF